MDILVFLTIINVASQQLWNHSVYIDCFLKQLRIQQTNPSISLTVTTTKDGYLAKSQAFEDKVGKFDFQVQPTKYNYVNRLMLNHVDVYIQTNGGDDLSHLYAFRRTDNDHGYDVTTNAAGASHQMEL